MKPTEAVSPPPIDIDVTLVDPATLSVIVSGEIDMLTAAHLRATVVDAVNTYKPRSMVIDIAKVPFLDAIGMTALIQIYQHAHQHRVDVSLGNAQPLVIRALSAVNLLNFLHQALHS